MTCTASTSTSTLTASHPPTPASSSASSAFSDPRSRPRSKCPCPRASLPPPASQDLCRLLPRESLLAPAPLRPCEPRPPLPSPSSSCCRLTGRVWSLPGGQARSAAPRASMQQRATARTRPHAGYLLHPLPEAAESAALLRRHALRILGLPQRDVCAEGPRVCRQPRVHTRRAQGRMQPQQLAKPARFLQPQPDNAGDSPPAAARRTPKAAYVAGGHCAKHTPSECGGLIAANVTSTQVWGTPQGAWGIATFEGREI